MFLEGIKKTGGMKWVDEVGTVSINSFMTEGVII